MTIWYTYFLIDPRTDKTFYVGKGKTNRMYLHMTRALKWKQSGFLNQKVNKHLYYTLLQIHEANLDPIYVKIFESDVEKQCLDREKLEIQNIGLENLCNITHGGEGELKTKETLLKMSKSLRKFWDSSDGYILREKFSQNRSGDKNPRWGAIELDEEKKNKRMAPMLSKPRWNKGLKGDPRVKGAPKGNIPTNALKCRLINNDGRIFEADSMKQLSIVSGVPLVTINRLRSKFYKKNKAGWSFELQDDIQNQIEKNK